MIIDAPAFAAEALVLPASGATVSAAAAASEFAGFAEQLRRDLAPASLLETVLAGRVVMAAWRLRAATETETGRVEAGKGPGPISREVLRAECSLETALSLFRASRNVNRPVWGRFNDAEGPAEGAEMDDLATDGPDLSNEWPTLPPLDSRGFPEVAQGADDAEGDEAAEGPARACWQDRLVFDFNVSETSPVVKGTWITVSRVVSQIVDGWSWADVLRAHPELTEDDVRTCLAYAAAQDDDRDV